MVRPPFHVSVCPSPALGLGWVGHRWVGHRSVAPPAAPVCWALLESRLRRSDALASGRTLSFYFLAWGFLPWAFVRTWVGRLHSCLGSYLLLGALSFPCPGFCWAVPAVWLSRLLVFSWNLYLGSFPSLRVCCWLEVVKVNPWLSTLRGLAVEVVPWFLSGTCRLALVGLQCLWIPWSCVVPGLPVGSPVSGRVCVLPQSTLVKLLSHLLVGLAFSLCEGSPPSG